jgi:hypothetical protein
LNNLVLVLDEKEFSIIFGKPEIGEKNFAVKTTMASIRSVSKLIGRPNHEMR